MKHIPWILAFLVGLFLAFCLVFEEPTIWLWADPIPPWYQSNLLGQIGFYMKIPTLWLIEGIWHLAHISKDYEPPNFVQTLLLYSPFLTIAIIALLVFCFAKLLLRRTRPNHALQRTEAGGTSLLHP